MTTLPSSRATGNRVSRYVEGQESFIVSSAEPRRALNSRLLTRGTCSWRLACGLTSHRPTYFREKRIHVEVEDIGHGDQLDQIEPPLASLHLAPKLLTTIQRFSYLTLRETGSSPCFHEF